MNAPTPDVVYVRPSSCQLHLPPLTTEPTEAAPLGTVLRAGQVVPCPDCGRVWQVVQTIARGGVVQVGWECYRPASVPDPVATRLTALETRAGAVEARLATVEGTIATINTTVATINTTISALTSRTVTVHRAIPAAMASIAVNGTQTLTVTWKTAFPDANYVVEALPVAALIGKVTPTVTAKTATGCTITVTSTVLVAVGAALLDVTAVRYA